MGVCPAGMPYEFASPEIVVIYRLHAGGLQGLCGSFVCGSVWAPNTRTEPVQGPYYRPGLLWANPRQAQLFSSGRRTLYGHPRVFTIFARTTAENRT